MQNLPYNAMRVFEAAARHKSFTKAAQELHITQTAVSKQVSRLEAFLNVALFIRHHRSLELTDAGREIARGTAEGMQHIEKTIHRLSHPIPDRLTILTDVDFARLWLFPLLPDFEQKYPDVQITLATKNFTLPIEEEETFDVAISWGQGKWEQTLFEPLMVNETFPVCSPDYFRDRPIDISTLAPNELIHDRTTHWWRAFLDKAGGQDINSGFGRIFTQTSLCLESAARGDGVAIGDEVSTRAYLQSGALITPVKDRIPSPDAYYLLQERTVGAAQDSVAAFRAWVLEKAAKHRIWYSEYWAQE